MLKSNAECEFCKIINGTHKARIVCETQDTLAFFPLKPVARGHTLVVPKSHVRDIWSLDPKLGSKVLDSILMVSRALKRAPQEKRLAKPSSTYTFTWSRAGGMIASVTSGRQVQRGPMKHRT